MIELLPWTKRSWSFDLPVRAFPALLERLRGTPARAEDLASGVDDRLLGVRPVGSWSVKEHIGHLDDLGDLDSRRLDEYLAGATVLSAADTGNKRTEEAAHNLAQLGDIIDRLRRHRTEFVGRLEQLSEDLVSVTAEHPRLRRPMRLIDWIQFVAEHDDHHLASARAAMRAIRAMPIETVHAREVR
jgi:hypothetical protein